MTLEDFFTSTELKDGLTTPTRVNDLITVIQNQKENIVKNVSEASRQWSAVANTIAATESKECLELFIQLDGLVFINKWLNDSQSLIDDTGTSLLEELVVALLWALERLQVDHHHSVGSGVGLTVQGLVGHSSLTVREKAKDLCDKWVPVQNNDGEPANVDSVNINEEKVSVQQETDKQERVTQEVVKESATEITESESLEDANEKQKIDSVTALSSTLEDTTLTSSTDVVHGLESVTKTDTMEEKTNKDEDMVNGRESQSPVLQTTTPDANTASGNGDSASGGDGSENPKSSSSTESDEDEKKDTGIESDGNSGSPLPVSKQSAKSQNEDLITKRPSDMELDYGMVDPLELARQVANEVELEVDSPEQSCSTSTSEKEHRSSPVLGHEVSSGPAPAPVLEPELKSEPMANSETLDNSTLDPEKGFSGFDLNEEIAFEETETECQVGPLLTPVSVVAAANGPPVAPLQFEGALGWKGSAATSAFRRITEGEKTISSSSSHSNSTQRLTHFDFDLNVAEASEDKIQLDLNSLGDSDASIVTLDWKRETRVTPLKQNGPHSPSVSSSMQPSYRNIDLNFNDHLTVPNNASSNNPFLGKLFNNTQDESVISIFGTQVEVNCKDNNNHNIPPVQSNGRLLEPSVDFNLGRPVSGLGLGLGSSIPYSNVPAYGYTHNGFTMGPMYAPPGAPIPYMVDSRGAPIIPPIQPIQPAFSQNTQPFFFNMGAPSASNGAGPSRNALDLDSGFVTDRGNNIYHNGGLRQFLNHDQASSSTRGDNINHNGGLRQFLNHDQASSSTRGNNINHNGGLRQFLNHDQASSSATIGGKRDQPDSGWDLFPINYKHQQPPWQ